MKIKMYFIRRINVKFNNPVLIKRNKIIDQLFIFVKKKNWIINISTIVRNTYAYEKQKLVE